jgi:hypothetical protein
MAARGVLLDETNGWQLISSGAVRDTPSDVGCIATTLIRPDQYGSLYRWAEAGGGWRRW